MEKKFFMKIDYANLDLQYKNYKKSIDDAIFKVVKNSKFIMGEEVHKLEKNLAKFTGVKHAITCSSGTDALSLAMMAMDIQSGDEIITTPFTWISTAETIALLNARPVFVDIESDTFNIDTNLIETVITKNTKAIIPVSLFGQPSDMDQIQKIVNKYDLKVIIDGAQSLGSKFKNKTDSNLGDLSITSFFPSKPLGCYGDGGAVFTNKKNLSEKIKMLRVHGQYKRNYHKYIGLGGRLDTIQAAVLLAKLTIFEDELSEREKVAVRYTTAFSGSNVVIPPTVAAECKSAWAQYTVRIYDRDRVQTALNEAGIATAVHYPLPLSAQPAVAQLAEVPHSYKAALDVLSIPISGSLTHEDQDFVIKTLLKLAKSTTTSKMNP